VTSGLPWEGRSNLPWDSNSWGVAAEIAARHHRLSAAFVASTTGLTEPPLPLRSDPLTQLLLQTVVNPDQGADRGKIVEAVLLPFFDIIEILKKDPSAAFQIPWDKWEEIIAGIYKQSRFEKVILTPRSGDYGRDVIAEKRGLGTVRVIDSAKHSHLLAS
jgi:Restriction endonuclease